ncbi:MAG: RsmE family RNA methyltransferase [Treponema sp.]|nr:RsmE family RNA methyltransferase [Treponema sp.]
MRQFVSSRNPDKNGLIVVEGKDFRYFRQVLRLNIGDMLSVRIPDGQLVNTTVCKIDDKKHSVTLQLCDTIDSTENQSSFTQACEFYLFQFVAKGQKMDLIIRQATECGVRAIIPVSGEFCQAGAAEKNFKSERYERIIKEARQQSGSPVNTGIETTMSLEGAIEHWKNICKEGSGAVMGCVLYERSEKTIAVHKVFGQFEQIKKCAIVCGAEGGISPREIELLQNGGFTPVHFDTNILRCETAALYGIAAVQSAVLEKNLWQSKE